MVTEDNETVGRLRQRICELEAELNRLHQRSSPDDDSRLLATVVDNSPVGIALVEDRKIVWGNATMARILGSNDYYLGQSTRIIYATDEDYERTSKELYRNAKDGRTPAVDFTLRRLDGTTRDATVQVTAIDPGNPMGRAVATIVDITDRKKAERDLADSEARFRELADLLPEPVFEATPKGVVTYANRAALTALRATEADLGVIRARDTVVPEDRARVENALAGLVNGQPPAQNEYTVLRRDGTTFPGFVTTSLVWKDGEFAGFRGVIIDLTEQKAQLRLEHRAQQAEKLEALATLAGGIAHDFNNLLFIVMGYVELAREDSSDEVVTKSLDEALQASEQARDLARQMISFGRQSRPSAECISTVEVIEESLRVVESSLAENVSLSFSPRTSSCLKTDPTQLRQVVTNLCLNAAQAMSATGGVIRIVVKDIELVEDAVLDVSAGKYVAVEVFDEGPGIDPSIVSRIFDPYFTTKKIGRGTGLGLAVVQGMAHANGGHVTVESEQGKGSCFRAFFPSKDDAHPCELARQTSLPHGSEHILVVDDEARIADLLERMLSSLGYRVTSVTSPTAAFDRVKTSDEFDLLLSDVVMPNMTGHELARATRELRPQLPIVLCSGSAFVGNAKMHEFGYRLLPKPITIPELAQVVREAIDVK